MDNARDGLNDNDEVKVKLENTFAIVREGDGELQGMNNPLSDFNGLNLGEFEQSELRHKADDEGIFEQTILRDGGQQLDQSLIGNINLFDQFRQPQKDEGIDFSGFGLNFINKEEEIVKDDVQSVWKLKKRQEKLRKEFEKLVLGKDTNINSIESQRIKPKTDFYNVANCFSFEANSNFMEASTGTSSGLVERIFLKKNEDRVKLKLEDMIKVD